MDFGLERNLSHNRVMHNLSDITWDNGSYSSEAALGDRISEN